MIALPDLKHEDLGREVRYTTRNGDTEYGRITSWNSKFIFVRYHLKIRQGGQRIPLTGETSEATEPSDLCFC